MVKGEGANIDYFGVDPHGLQFLGCAGNMSALVATLARTCARVFPVENILDEVEILLHGLETGETGGRKQENQSMVSGLESI